ncbi:MAG: DUF3261 domain-containing protein [Proteobacteria bacterium]|nr:DUF3261 domain-containing protein [Pseudomonadota bacterium]MBU1595070.1 DUF3261 domain-containing protein [Pseudomonadota bacterium]
MLRRAAALAALALMIGCSAARGTVVDHTPDVWHSWCGEGPALRERFDFVLEARGFLLSATGFLVLAPQEQTINAVLLNPMGIKLITLRITPDEVRSLQDSSPLPARLTEQIGLALRRALLLAWPCLVNGPTDEDAFRRALSSGVRLQCGPEQKQVSAHGGGADWSAQAWRTDLRVDQPPREIVVRDERSGFTLKLVRTEAYDEH